VSQIQSTCASALRSMAPGAIMPVMGGVQAALLIRNCELGDERTVNEAQVAVYIVHTMRWNCLT